MEHLRNDAQRRHHAKADVYRMLSACYYEPEEAFLEEDVFGQLEQALSVLGSERTADAEAMGACFREASYEDLRIDFYRASGAGGDPPMSGSHMERAAHYSKNINELMRKVGGARELWHPSSGNSLDCHI